jgi:hypothetical protein
MRWKPEVWPKANKLIYVDELSNIVFGTFAKDEFVDLNSLSHVAQVPSSIQTAPKDVEGQLDHSECSVAIETIKVLRKSDRPRPSVPAALPTGLCRHARNRTGMGLCRWGLQEFRPYVSNGDRWSIGFRA